MISISSLTKEFGDRTLFADASLQLNAGERYGLVGANGSGKTTFLKILSGDEEASAGSVSIANRVRLGVLRQDQFLYEHEEILNVAMMGNAELWEAMVAHHELLANAHEHFDEARYTAIEDIIHRHDGYTAEARAAAILEGLGLPADVHRQPLSTLSGGFKLRVLLAQVLASAPDVLLLDEPTNHLDILSIAWLEGFIHDFAGPVVIISHDHQFLDGIATHILDVDYQQITKYTGNYTRFVDAKREERERREKDIASRSREIAQTMEFVERFKAKASKARQAQSKLRMVERKQEEMQELPVSSRRYPNFRLLEQRASGRDVLKTKGIKKTYGEKAVLHGVDLEVRRGDRIAIMGPNGIGKSTLLKVIMGEIAPDAGDVEWGYETYRGYFAQDHHEELESVDSTAEDWVWQFCPDKGVGYVRGELALMLFSGDDPKKRLNALSGGEAARLVFTRMAIEKPNVLVLDEPTNHLDLESIEALVEGLKSYTGTLIFVSHDRWFIGQLATRIVDIEATGVTDYHGTYEEYVAHCGKDRLNTQQVLLEARGQKSKGKSKPKQKPDKVLQRAK
jgi:ATPase subunit of ABC transporter with duplicated ATPase domains